MATQTAMPVSALHAMGQTRSRAIVTDTLRQVSRIFSSRDPTNPHLRLQAGAAPADDAPAVQGALQVAGGYTDDLTVGDAVPTALEVGVFAGASANAGAERVAVRVPSRTLAGSDYGEYTLRSADADGSLTWARSDTLPRLTVANDLVVGGRLVLDSGTFSDLRLANLRVTNNLTIDGVVTSVRSEDVLVRDRRIELGAVSRYAPPALFRPDRALDTVPYHFNGGDADVHLATSRDFGGVARVVVEWILVQSTGADWVHDVWNASPATATDAERSTFRLVSGGADVTLRVACPQLFARGDDPNPYASALKAVTAATIVKVDALERDGAPVGLDGADVYAVRLAVGDDARGSPVVYPIDVLTTPTAAALGLVEDATVPLDLAIYDDDARIGGGIALKGATDAAFEFVKTPQVFDPLRPGYRSPDTAVDAYEGPAQLQGWYTNFDVALGEKTAAHSAADASRLGDARRRSNVIHMGDLHSDHFMIVSTWTSSEHASSATGSYSEGDAPKLQFYYGRDLFDDRALDGQDDAPDGAPGGPRTHLVFEISAPLDGSGSDSSPD